MLVQEDRGSNRDENVDDVDQGKCDAERNGAQDAEPGEEAEDVADDADLIRAVERLGAAINQVFRLT